MPETVWDYVAKLKTSVTKASSKCRPITMLFIVTVDALILMSLLLLGIVCDPVSSSNRRRGGGICLPFLLFQQSKTVWCCCQQ